MKNDSFKPAATMANSHSELDGTVPETQATDLPITFSIEKPQEDIRPLLIDHINNLTKPKGSLGVLEDLALQIGMIQQTLTPCLKHPHNLLFAADHGIVEEGVSVSPKEVTWQQLSNFLKGGAGINFLCRQHGFRLVLIDAGVDYDLPYEQGILPCSMGRGTRNFLHGPAMTEAAFNECLRRGASVVDQVADQGCNVVSFGEMGIGNTSPSSMWMHLLTGIPLLSCIGAGSGLDSEGLRHKYKILSRTFTHFQQTFSDVTEDVTHAQPLMTHAPLQADATANDPKLKNERQRTLRRKLAWLGGFEMAMAVGGMLRAAERRMVILVDGFIMTNCMLAAYHLYPEVLAYAIFGHQGDEAGHKLVLEALHARPLLHLGFRLGEGTGAICAYPIVESAVRMLNEMDTFDRASITKYF